MTGRDERASDGEDAEQALAHLQLSRDTDRTFLATS